MAGRTEAAHTTRVRVPAWAAALVALAAVGIVLGLLWRVGTGSFLEPPPAPIQNIEFERVTLREGSITAVVRNAGPDAVDIAQVLVDEAYWRFTATPDSHLGRLQSATIEIPYQWVPGEPVGITIVDATGTTFTHEIPVASATPVVGGRTVAGYILLGTYAGVVPVFLGLLFLPSLRRLREGGWRFLLGLTGGLLAFLGVDALDESLELAGEIASVFQGTALVFGGVVASVFGLVAITRWLPGGTERAVEGAATPSDRRSPLAVAYLIAIGIGLHNFGEGLAIGSAQALGEVALGTFLVMGFALHNLTEGVGILAPTLRHPPRIRHLLALGAIAGAPTIMGTLVGGFAYSKVLGTLLFAIGVGAIFQVLVELARLVRRRHSLLAPSLVAGLAAGFVLMYATGLLIKA